VRKRYRRAVRGSALSTAFVLICIFAGAPTDIVAQESFVLEPGERVRVTAPTCGLGLSSHVTQFRALRAGTLVLDTSECAVASVTGLDVSRGQKSNTTWGVVIGFAAGALGAIAYCSQDKNEFSNEGKCVLFDDDTTLLQVLIFGAGGGLVGGFVGYLIKTDRWEAVPLDRLRVGLAPQRDGRLMLGFSAGF